MCLAKARRDKDRREKEKGRERKTKETKQESRRSIEGVFFVCVAEESSPRGFERRDNPVK